VTKYKTKTWNVSAWAAVRWGTGSERYQDSSRRDEEEEKGIHKPQNKTKLKTSDSIFGFLAFNEASDIDHREGQQVKQDMRVQRVR